MAENKTRPTTSSVGSYIEAIGDETRRKDCRALAKLMARATKRKPVMRGTSIVGFGSYHYKYDSGREGDGHILGFYPRKGRITVYLMDGTARYGELLATLGKHTTTGYCVYLKRLSDIELPVLEQMLQQSYTYIKSKSQDGPIDRILWQTEN